MRILDLFCCGGGASMGICKLGHELVGVDIEPQPEYPFEFIQKDVFTLTSEWVKDNFDAVWASPKCQAFSIATSREQKQKELNQIPDTRELLEKTGLPYVIENVPLAPLKQDLLLCGEMFGLRVIRHRIFEIKGFKVIQPEHPKHKDPTDYPIDFWAKENEGLIMEPIPISTKRSYYAQVAGHGGNSYDYSLKAKQEAMGIDWITNVQTLNQAIPPAYSKYIFRFLELHN